MIFDNARISLIVGGALLLFLGVLPFFISDRFLISSLTVTLLFSLFGAAWDLTYGVGGLPNFGPGVPFGVGAFSLAMLAHHGYSPPIAFLLAGIAGASTGIIFWIPSIRAAGGYLALLTIILLLLAGDIALVQTGEEGLSIGIKYFAPSVLESYYEAFALSAASMFLLFGIKQSKFGLRLRAMRDDEIAAKSVAIKVIYFKLIVFVISSLFLAFAGAYYVLYTSSVNYQIFSFTNNFLGVAVGVIGGVGTIFGSLIGALLVELPSLYLLSYGSYSLILYGSTMIVIMLFWRAGALNGIVALVQRFSKKTEEKES